MRAEMLSYLLALDIFAITVLIMAVGPTQETVRGVRKRLLRALFALVTARSIYLLAFLWFGTLSDPFAGSLEVLSMVCIIWALVKPSAIHFPRWRIYARAGLALTGLLILLLWLVPALSWQPIAALVGLASLPLVFSRYDKARWSHILTPIILAIAALLNWLEFVTTGQFITLIGFGALVYAIFIETAIHASTRRREVETLGAETQRHYIERLQFMEISNLLSAAPSPADSLDHAVQTIGKAAHVEQVVILSFDRYSGQGHVAAVYRPTDPQNYTALKETPFNISEYPLLLDALERQHQLIIQPSTHPGSLKKLHNLWHSRQTGSTALQPLLLKQKSVGVLVLANSKADKAIESADLLLCQKLGAQLAAMVVFQQEHRHVESKAQELAAQAQLSQGNYEQLQNIIETISDGVIASNTDGRIHLVNRTAERLLGQPRQQLLGQPFGAIFGDANSRESIEKLAIEFSRSNQALPTYFEREGQAVQGRLIPLRNSHQDWMGIVAVLWDVTAAVYTDETRSKFVDTLSREIRTPLTTVKGYLDMILAGVGGPLNIQQEHYLKLIQAGANRAAEVINKAQQTVNDSANVIKLDVRKVDLKRVINASSNNLRPLIEAKSLNFTIDLAPDLPSLQADEATLRQILDGLLLNACKFSKDKGDVALKVWSQSEGVNGYRSNYLIFTIVDSSSGLPNYVQRRIRNPHSRMMGNFDDREGRIGSGLSTMKTLIETQGGRLWVESEEGKGSRFQVALPCAVT